MDSQSLVLNTLPSAPQPVHARSVYETDQQLRSRMEELINQLINSLGDTISALKKSGSAHEIKRLEEFFNKLQKSAKAKRMSKLVRIFMKIAMAFAIAVTALLPAPPVLTVILIAVLAAQLAGEIYADATGKSSFVNEFMKKVCGGNSEIAKWVTMGIDIALALLTGGAALMSSCTESLVSVVTKQLAAMAERMANTTTSVGTKTAVVTGSAGKAMTSVEQAALDTLGQRLLAAIKSGVKRDIDNLMLEVANFLSIGAGIASGITSIAEHSIKIQLAKIQYVLDVLEALITSDNDSVDRINQEAGSYQSSIKAIREGRLTVLDSMHLSNTN